MTEAERFHFEKVGLGYRLWPVNDKIVAELKISRIKRRSEELHGFLQVTCNFEGVKTNGGVLHSTRFNMSAGQTRKQVATLLKSRTPGFEDMDWFDALETLCQRVAEAESRGEPIVEIGNARPPGYKPVRYSLEPLVPKNVASLLYGPGGAGKSATALAGALSVATNTEIIPGIKPAISGPVLYLDWETDQDIVNDRLWSLCTGAGVQPKNVSYRRCNRPLADDAEELSMLVAKLGIVYLVIDSCGPAMGTSGEYGDANESTLRLFEAIRHIGVSTQVVDHVSKQEMRSGKNVTGLLPYGSIYKVNLARAAWELRNDTTSDDDDLHITLYNTKANDARLHEPIRLMIDWTPGSITFAIDSETRTTAPTSGGGLREGAHELLEDGSRTVKYIAQTLNVKESSVRGLLVRHPQEFERDKNDPEKIALVSTGGIGGPGPNVVSFMAARGPEH